MNDPSRDVPDAECFSLFDTHAHLDQHDFDADRGDVIARAKQAGVRDILCVGVSAESSRAALQVAEEHGLLAAVGIHPNSTTDAGADDWRNIAKLAEHPRVAALGETGLDRYWDNAPLSLQQDYLDRHLRLSQERGLPLVIHCRDAVADLMPMLHAAAKRGPLLGVMHAFSGDVALVAECVSLGLYVSFAGNVTYTNRKFDVLRAAATAAPADRLLVETDSPYLIPQAFRGRQKRNEPAHVIETAAFLANLRGVSLHELAAQTTANARRLFHVLR